MNELFGLYSILLHTYYVTPTLNLIFIFFPKKY